jgi:hypothetical protein
MLPAGSLEAEELESLRFQTTFIFASSWLFILLYQWCMVKQISNNIYRKGKSVPLQAWIGPEGSRKLSFPDFLTTAQDGGKVVSLRHRPHLPPGNTPGTHFFSQDHSVIRKIMSMKNSIDTI